MNKRRNPLAWRLLRELKEEIGKYIVIFLLIASTISLCSGFLVADGSMLVAYNESFEKYHIENGHFQTEKKLNGAQRKRLDSYDVSIYDLTYFQTALSNGSTLRIFAKRDEINLECLMDGSFPEKEGEIAIDRMYAENNGLQVGDTIQDEQETWTITGLIALSDYSSLFEKNTDSMFDAVQFGVAVLPGDVFASLTGRDFIWNYAWTYPIQPQDDSVEKNWSDDFMEFLNQEVNLKDYVPRYNNQAINFTGSDMGGDRAMILILLYIVIAIMAFVFGITISNTIRKEANVIGTLRALGYTKGEMLAHYMILPLAVALVGALVGNILGYTIMKDVCAGMYYGSYSLPTYVTVWNGEAFFLTTVIPILLIFVIDAIILTAKLQLSPLRFLRNDLGVRRRGYSIPLSSRIPFLGRFQIRVIFQNFPGYLMMFFGIMFVNLLILFGLGMPGMIDYFQAEMENNRICDYQYMLNIPVNMQDSKRKIESTVDMLRYIRAVETDVKGVEKFSAYTLKTVVTDALVDDVILYGITPDSAYIDLDTSGEKIYISSAYADKFKLVPGDTITLKEAYEDKTYTLTIDGIYDYMGGLNVYMDQTCLNRMFDMEDDMFVGYFSNQEITDIDEKYIGSVIDLEALTKISRQLDVSMGSMMGLFVVFASLIFVAVIYLLSKIIIEKNANYISMTKILGYSSFEVLKLYLLPTTLVVLISLVVVEPINYYLLTKIFGVIMRQKMSGWIPLYVEKSIYVQAYLIGAFTYLFVMLLEIRRIRKIPMDIALKQME